MTNRKVLLPYNFTRSDQKALDFVICTFAKESGVEITLFNSYIPLPDFKASKSTVMERTAESLRYLSQKIKEQENELKGVKLKLLQSGFSEKQIRYIYSPRKKDIASDIVCLATEGKFDLIVLNRVPGKVTRYFTRSIFIKAINALKGITVCIVS